MKSLLSYLLIILLACGTMTVTIEPAFAKKKASTTAKTPKKKKKAITKAKKKKPTKAQKEAEKKKKFAENQKKKAKYVRETLKWGVHKNRIDAINRIEYIKDKGVKKDLYLYLVKVMDTEADADTLKKALTVLGEYKIKEAESLMIKSLDNDSDDVKIAAIHGINKIKAVKAKKKLLKAIKAQDFSKDSRYTNALLISLGNFKAVELIEFAKKTFEDTKTTKILRQNLVLFFGRLKSKKPKDFLLKLYKDKEEDLTLRAYAVNSLGKLNIKEATPAIKKMIAEIDLYSFKKKKKYYNLKIYSIQALVKMGDKAATPILMNALRSDNAMVRYRSIKLIKELKDKRTIDILKYKMKYDPSKKVRKEAEKALKELGVDVKKLKEKDENK